MSQIAPPGVKPRGSAPGWRQAGEQLAEQVEQLGLLGFIQPRQQAAHDGHVRRHDAVDQGEAGFASLCLAFPPLLTYVLALALRMEGLQRLRLLGILIGLAGSLILALGKLGSGDSPLLWVLATLVMPVFLAIGNVYRSRHWPEGARPLQLAPGMLLAGALLLLPLGLFGVELRPAWEQAAGAWWLAAEVALFAGMYALYFVLQKVAGAVYLSQIGSVTAITGAAVAIFLLGEQGSASMLLAALCTTVGVALVALRPAR